MSNIKLCDKDKHKWEQVGKCKDVLGHHPCIYYPEGCDTCLTRFECYTKDNDIYKSRVSSIFYACKKCPAVKSEGVIMEWKERTFNDILDITGNNSWIGMSDELATKLRNRWIKMSNKI
jgi:hypothetical protein